MIGGLSGEVRFWPGAAVRAREFVFWPEPEIGRLRRAGRSTYEALTPLQWREDALRDNGLMRAPAKLGRVSILILAS